MALALCAAAPGVRGQVAAFHDLTSAAYQTQFSTLTGRGYRVIALSIYGTASDQRYAAVFVRRSGPSYVGFHGLTAAQYQALVNLRGPQGYTATVLSAHGSGSSARFAGFLERQNSGYYLRHGLSEQQFIDEVDRARANGWRIATADVYGSSLAPRYIVGFERRGAVSQGYAVSSSSAYQTHFGAFVQGHARPEFVATNGYRYVSGYTNESRGNWAAHHGMTAATYQSRFNTYSSRGMYPISIAASGSGSGRRFAAIWSQSDLNRSRSFSASGQAVPSMASFDGWVQNWMRQNDARSAALAVVRDGRLMYARGFKYAESDYPTTSPTSLFRIASVSKPLTSISVHQHFERRPRFVSPSRKFFDYLPSPTVFASETRDITLYELLTHQGGWDRDVSQDPMFRDTEIASARGLTLPITKYDIRRFMTESQGLDFAPGSRSVYSNYGFSLLGQVLEVANLGQTYEQVVQRDVLTPLGITRARVRGELVGERLSGEVRYHPTNPGISRSVRFSDRRWVASQYASWNQINMDSHGAWVMSAPDFAKILAAFDLGDDNPLMSAATADSMWTVAPGYGSVMSGWYRVTVPDAGGRSVAMAHHNGRLRGSGSVAARRADGLSFVFFTNSDTVLDGTVIGPALNALANNVASWPDHDLFPSVGLPSLRSRVTGRYASVGTGCAAGRSGVLQLAGRGEPALGGSALLTLQNGTPGAQVLFSVGASLLRGIDLTGFGAPGCSLYHSAIVSLPGVVGRVGSVSQSLPIPDDRALVGARLRAQGIASTSVNRLGFATSNAVDLTIGGWR